jgi:hypothetical protein
VGGLPAKRVRTVAADDGGGGHVQFVSWSDGMEQEHDIVTGATPSSYTANFKACTKSGTSAGETLDGTSSDDVICGFGGNDTVRARGAMISSRAWEATTSFMAAERTK